MNNTLNEMVKSFFKPKKDDNVSSYVEPQNVLVKPEEHETSGIFFDESNTIFGLSRLDEASTSQLQQTKIRKYRQTAMNPDVDEAIDIIVNEIIFSYNDELPVAIQCDLDNDKLERAIGDKFTRIAGLMNLKRNFFQIVKRTYIDGQINLHCPFGKNPKDGIQTVNMIEPCGLQFDRKDNIWYYTRDGLSFNRGKYEGRFSPEELVHENFGLYNDKVILSYLEYAIKTANMLRTLEDLLIPMRFSRSISRRVFNVDIGDLPPKRGAEVMREHQAKFKYRKFYNNETGEVSNQQHITSLVEDYWFSNRSGGRGTTVDLLDESGNLGELGDVMYFANKLYKSLKIPANRRPGSQDAQDFDFNGSNVSREDLQFFMFISRLRKVFSSALKQVLKREVISTGIMNAQEWEENQEFIKVVFVQDNTFIEKLNLFNFTSKLDIYAQAQEYKGKLFSVETILKEIFKYSDQDIKDESDRIAKEMKDPAFKRFYDSDPDDFG